jgi:hypothetical protein
LRDNLSDRSLLKTKFVWHSWAAPKKEGVTLEDLYPGDEFVDWVGISVFQQLFPWSSNWANGYVNWGGDESDIHNVLTFAKMHGKVCVEGTFVSFVFLKLFFVEYYFPHTLTFSIIFQSIKADNDCRINPIRWN